MGTCSARWLSYLQSSKNDLFLHLHPHLRHLFVGLHLELHSPFLSSQALGVSLDLKFSPMAFRFDAGELDRCQTLRDVGDSFLLIIESGDRTFNVMVFIRSPSTVAWPRALEANKRAA